MAVDTTLDRPAAGLAPGEHGRARRVWRRLVRRRSAVVGMVFVLFFVAVAVSAPWIAPYDPAKANWLQVRKAPSLAHWMGTDEIGRDVMARMI